MAKMKMRNRLLPLLAMTALAGCSIAGGPKLDRNAVPAAPEAWSVRPELAASPISEGWVDDFGDVALHAAVEEAFGNNRNLQSFVARMRAARASMRVARADLFPRADFNGGVNNPQGTNAGATTYTGTLTASWEADLWGRNLARARAGSADARAAGADYVGARLTLAAAVTRAWYDLSAAKLTLDLAQRDLATRKDTLRITDARSRAGLASMLDVRLARVAVSNSEDRVEASMRASNNSRRALEVLVGRYPSAEAESATELITPAPLPNVTAPASVLAGRPDLMAAEARLDAAGLRAIDARHAMFPSLSLSFNATTTGARLGDIFNPATYISAIAGGLLQPLFRGGALIAEAERQGELARAALFDYAEKTLQAFQEVENRLDAEATLTRQVDATANAADEARTAVRLTRSRYVNGRSTIFDLLNAQTTAIAAETRAVEARRARIENRIQLHLALGDRPLNKPAIS